jgi:hypothetical protein
MAARRREPTIKQSLLTARFTLAHAFVFGKSLISVTRRAEHLQILGRFNAEPPIVPVMHFQSATMRRAAWAFTLAPILRTL